MEIFDKIFGVKRKKQEKLLGDLEVESRIVKGEFVGPDYEQADVVTINNDKFLKIVDSQKKKKFTSRIRNQDDTHIYREIFIDVGEDLKLKTGVDTKEHVTDQKTLLSVLFEKGFRQEKTIEEWSEHILKK